MLHNGMSPVLSHLFSKRALQKRLYSAKETCNLNESCHLSGTGEYTQGAGD